MPIRLNLAWAMAFAAEELEAINEDLKLARKAIASTTNVVAAKAPELTPAMIQAQNAVMRIESRLRP